MKNLIIDASQCAELLGISKASIKNWIKHGYLKPVDNTNKYFNLVEVNSLQRAIEKGEVNRLNRRANKAKANKRYIPSEYIGRKEHRQTVSTLLNYILNNQLDLKLTILALAVNLFVRNGDIFLMDVNQLRSFPPELFRRKSVWRELRDFWEELYTPWEVFYSCYHDLFFFPLPEEPDILGVVYQSLLREGSKANFGSYFTPGEIVNKMVGENIKPQQKVLDPCCGTGQFLLSFTEHIPCPENIWGIDIDPIAVKIARINLFLRYSQEFRPNIFNLNALDSDDLPKAFNLIATNPPWGAKNDPSVLRKMEKQFPEITSGESFSYFLRIGLSLLQDGGILSFILPESVLSVRRHEDIRKYLLQNCRLLRIEVLGKRFRNVFSTAIRLDLLKAKPAENHEVTVQTGDSEYSIPQRRFLNNTWFVLDIWLNKQDKSIIDKLYAAAHTTLKNRADWALGIVTGENARYIYNKDTPQIKGEGDNEVGGGDWEPIYKGSDIKPYILGEPSSYIRFTPERFQQVAREEKYRAKEKLIYKFISTKLVFAYDNRGSLTLNSANILIPKIDNYSLKAILALFNSTLYQFLYRKKFNSLKILKADLEQLPLPLWDTGVLNRLVELADGVLGGQDLMALIDGFIMEQFGLTEKEQEYITTFVSTIK